MFYLGIHQPHWLTETTVPLFISRRRLHKRKKMPRAVGLKDHGKWTIDARAYSEEVRRISTEVGGMDWAAIQDWMCEKEMLAITGLSIPQHQALTTRSFLDLRDIAPEIPWVPVLQGYAKGEYLDHLEQYARHGVDLTREPVVGLGTVCRRQATDEFAGIVRSLVACGVDLHGFGVKLQGLTKVAALLKSSDSLAWSYTARRLRRPALPQCIGGGHKNCANCLPFALVWRSKLLASLPPEWGGSSVIASTGNIRLVDDVMIADQSLVNS